MAGNTFGVAFRLTTFGESHGAAVGATIDGCPAGVPLDEAVVQAELNRRRPGSHGGATTAVGTARTEADQCEILSGVYEGRTEGTPIAVLIRNTSQHSADYGSLADTFRPGHADYAYRAKYGFRDWRGGGRSSGRETAGRVAGGAVAKAFLRARFPAYSAVAFTLRAAGVSCEEIDLSVVDKNPLRAADMSAAEQMESCIAALREQGDSAGGVVECRVRGVPAGLGEPVFDKLDAELAKAMLSLGAVKGIEFGLGFACAEQTGSAANDALSVPKDSAAGRNVSFKTNNAGSILGGISNGDEIVFRIAVKPVPSVSLPQDTVTERGGAYQNTVLRIRGRHDACICPRIVPVVEAMTHLVLADLALRNDVSRLNQ